MSRETKVPEEAVEAVAFRFATEMFPDYWHVGGWERFQDQRQPTQSSISAGPSASSKPPYPPSVPSGSGS